MPQFDVSTFYSQIFWLAVVFTFLYLIVSYFISPATEQIFQNRKIVIEDAVTEAEVLTHKTESLKAEYNIQYKNILNAADIIKKESIDNLNDSFARDQMSLLAEIDVKRKESLSEIERRLKSFLEDQPQACMELADFIIQKITDKKIDRKLLDRCYARVKL